MRGQPRSYCVAGALVVAAVRVVVFRVKIVVQENGVVGICAQQFQSLLDVVSDINKIAFEARRKPAMSSLVIVEEKNPNGMAFCLNFAEAEFAQQ